MKLKDGFALRKFADKWIAVSINDNADEHNLFITLNKTGAYVWEVLQSECTYAQLLEKITEKYDVSADLAKADLDGFLEKIRKAGILDE